MTFHVLVNEKTEYLGFRAGMPQSAKDAIELAIERLEKDHKKWCRRVVSPPYACPLSGHMYEEFFDHRGSRHLLSIFFFLDTPAKKICVNAMTVRPPIMVI